MPFIPTVIRWYDSAANGLAHLECLPLLLARLTLGAVFIPSGWGKLNNLDKVVGFFTELGIPAPQFQAPLAAGSEFLFGITVLLGLFTRISAIPLAVIMVVAMATAKHDELVNSVGALAKIDTLVGFTEFLYLVLLIWLVVRGGGLLSLDRVLLRLRGGSSKPKV